MNTKTIIFFVAIVIAWLIISQMIAWLMTPADENGHKDKDAVLKIWAAVFLSIIVIPILILAWISNNNKRIINRKVDQSEIGKYI